jgi:sulfopyruvate decarboxylase subunit alpha
MNDAQFARQSIRLRAAGFDYVLTVPCSILRQWFDPADPQSPTTMYLSREEEGVGLAVGLSAAGRRPLLMIQNSGLGNCLNALCSLAVAYRVPLVVAVSMRGDALDDNPVQVPIGSATEQIIEAIGCEFTTVTRTGQAEALLADARIAAEAEGRPRFVLLPRLEALC